MNNVNIEPSGIDKILSEPIERIESCRTNIQYKVSGLTASYNKSDSILEKISIANRISSLKETIPQVMSFVKPADLRNRTVKFEYLKNPQNEIEVLLSKINWESSNWKNQISDFEKFSSEEIRKTITSGRVRGLDIALLYYLLSKKYNDQYVSKAYLIDTFMKSLMLMSGVARRAIQEQNNGNECWFDGNAFSKAHEVSKMTGGFLYGLVETPPQTFYLLESQFYLFRNTTGCGMYNVSVGACNVVIDYVRDQLKKCREIKLFDESIKDLCVANKSVRDKLDQINETIDKIKLQIPLDIC